MKKILGIIVLSLLLSGNVYAGWFDKLPVLACKIGDQHITYDLRKYVDISKKKYNKSNMPNKVMLEVREDEYAFLDTIDQDDGTVRTIRYDVNRFSGIINLYVSPKHVRFGIDALRSSLTNEFTYNGICTGAK